MGRGGKKKTTLVLASGPKKRNIGGSHSELEKNHWLGGSDFEG